MEVICDNCNKDFELKSEMMIFRDTFVYYYVCDHCKAYYIYDTKTKKSINELESKRKALKALIKGKNSEHSFKKANEELAILMAKNIEQSIAFSKKNEQELRSLSDVVYLPLIERRVPNV